MPSDNHQLPSEIQLDYQSLPQELWIAVFEAMERPTDLLAVINVCRAFRSLGIRSLYRNLQWLTPFDFTGNKSFWNSHGGGTMNEVPTSLTIGISYASANSFGRFDPTIAVVDADGSWCVPPAPRLAENMEGHTHSPQVFFASLPLYSAISDLASSFVNLQELVFHQAFLPDTIYQTIRNFPKLESLSIQYCTMPSRGNAERNSTFDTLPITHLTLWRTRGDMERNYSHMLAISCAPNIRGMRVDWTTGSASFFASHCGHGNPPHFSFLESLELRMPPGKSWPSTAIPAHNVLLHSLKQFLASCLSLKKLTIWNHLPYFELEHGSLPQLTHYAGPITSVFPMISGRPVEHLEVFIEGKELIDNTKFFPRLGDVGPQLKSLSIMLYRWDSEVLYPITQLFPELRKLCIQYEIGYPSEYTLLSLGPQFLSRLPHLEVLHLLRPASAAFAFLLRSGDTQTTFQRQPSTPIPDSDLGPGDGPDVEVRELILPWTKTCRRLTEVQFVPNFVWKRAFDGDEWCKRSITPPDRFRDLVP
ncbi:hypothetical protein BD779DRAFT_1474670 [Infundibulicybe gibba]|nr:hypothetical protein BD779DRAFT_1474670 [Infundibulicybe gibba]